MKVRGVPADRAAAARASHAESASASRIVVRQARCQDGESVGTFLAGLSGPSRYQRFFSAVRDMAPAQVRTMVMTTPRQHVLLALDGETVVGHVMAVRVGDRTVDMGIVVAEAYRCRGIGNRLVRELAEAVIAAGLTEVRCDVLIESRFVLNWLRRVLAGFWSEHGGNTVTVHGSLTPDTP